jgi:predicted permease
MFLNNMLLAAEQVAILYLIVAVGVVADRTGLFTESTARLCTNLLFFIITPAVIIRSFLVIDYDPKTAQGLFIAIGCGLLLHLVAAVINIPLFRKGDRDKNSVLKFACVYGNCGYMALPLANEVLGPEGVFYCSAVIMAFQMFVFTHGVLVMSGPDNKGKKRIEFKKLFINPGLLSVAIGLPLFLLSVTLPKIIQQPIEYIASMNTPLAMLIFGAYLSHTDIKKLFSDAKILIAGFSKLIVLPLVMMGLFRLFGLTGTLLAALTISASAPTANNTVIFAARYGRDPGFASKTVAIISFISILTMPFMIALSITYG